MSYKPSFGKRIFDNLRILFELFVSKHEPVAIPKDTVVVVLDVIEPYRRLWDVVHAAHLCAMVNAARKNGHRVVFTRWARTRFLPADAISRKPNAHWSHFVQESSLDADGKARFLHPLLVQNGDAVIDAVHTNVLAHKDLELPSGAPLLLAGMWTESCVLNSARGAVEDDRDVFVYAPACAGHLHMFSLWTLASLYANVIFKLKWD